ncbi:peptidase domain-containing ABC transporter [Terasakiella pusilla]|uniref:peptidase domain-containing ABC transporter n=1 Tax=Terasakiella pusilla TaxID=64973 RepID=UPI0006905C47|nr:peptidase domain-containing ABC transporter [Terasakiella pusilla]
MTETVQQISWDQRVQRAELSQDQIMSGQLGGFKAVTDIAACLLPLLTALEWEGSQRTLSEALPHFANELDLTDFLNIVGKLGFKSQKINISLKDIDPRIMPCLFLPKYADAIVVLGRNGDLCKIYDPEQQSVREIEAVSLQGTAYVFIPADTENLATAPKVGFVSKIFGRFRGLVWRTLMISMICNILALATPLFIMAVYDKYVATGSNEMLYLMIAGVSIALLGDFFLKGLKSRMIAYIGGRLDHIIGRAVFRQLLFLAPSFTEMSNTSSQISRLRDFETVRDFFSGPIASTVFEAPFVIIFVIAMAILGGPLVLVPLGALVVFTVLLKLFLPVLRDSVIVSSRASTKRHDFVTEAITKKEALQDAGVQSVWAERYRHLSADTCLKGYKSSQISSLCMALAQGVIMAAGVATLTYGVHKVIAGEMTVGALLASMIMVWWILRPIQVIFLGMTQLEQVRSSVMQIDSLMEIRNEREEGESPTLSQPLKGHVTFNRVSMRYTADTDPAVVGVSFEAKPGELIALVGPNGCGKSTLMKMLLGMYLPQAGAITIDNVDIRQMDPIQLRQSVAYVPQTNEVFFGTIAQNIRLSDPTATDEEVEWALRQADVWDDIQELPEKLMTRLGDQRSDLIPDNLIQRIALARGYLRRAPILLLDEPVNGLDFESDQVFMETLKRIKGNATILMISHRPSHLRIADKIVYLDGGVVRMAGPAAQVLDRIPQGGF